MAKTPHAERRIPHSPVPRSRLLMITDSLAVGGGPLMFLQCAEALDRARFEVALALTVEQGEWFARLRPDRYAFVRCWEKRSPVDLLRRHDALARLIAAWRPAAVVSWLRSSTVLAALALARRPRGRRPVHIVRQLCGYDGWRAAEGWRGALRTGLVQGAERGADFVIFNSARVRARSIAHAGYRPSRCALLPNAVASPAPAAAGAAFRARWGLTDAKPLLLVVGGLTMQKAPERALDVLARLAGEFPRARLAFIGDGPRRPALAARAAAPDLAGRVVFTGRLDGAGAAFAAADLCLHLARFEGTPNALVEALAAGCPVVAGAVDGIVELAGADERAGAGPAPLTMWLVPDGDLAAAADAARAALGNHEERARRLAAGRALVARLPTVAQAARRFEALVARVISARL